MQFPRILRRFRREETWSEHERRAQAFVAERMRGMAHLSPDDVERRSEEALSQLDREETLREIAALHERVERRRAERARNMAE